MENQIKPVSIEIRAGGVHIEGYVNAVLRESRPVITPRGRVNEIVEQRTFSNALNRGNNIEILVDHDNSMKLGSTEQGNLQLYEDEIGLRAITDITDPYVVEKAKSNQIKGWSFGFTTNKDSLEMRSEKLPLRHLKDIDLKEVSLIINKIPCYSATSVEMRAGNEEIVEQRSFFEDLIPQELLQMPIEEVDTKETDAKVEAVDATEESQNYKVIDPNAPQDTPKEKAEELEPKPKEDTGIEEYEIKLKIMKLKRRN